MNKVFPLGAKNKIKNHNTTHWEALNGWWVDLKIIKVNLL